MKRILISCMLCFAMAVVAFAADKMIVMNAAKGGKPGIVNGAEITAGPESLAVKVDSESGWYIAESPLKKPIWLGFDMILISLESSGEIKSLVFTVKQALAGGSYEGVVEFNIPAGKSEIKLDLSLVKDREGKSPDLKQPVKLWAIGQYGSCKKGAAVKFREITLLKTK